jgi:hypothetical protein
MKVSVEAARGCGYRKPGGLYLVSGGLAEPCERLPLPVEACPTCSQGIKPARGWTWVDPRVLFPAQVHGPASHNAACPLGLNPVLDGGEWRDVISTSYHRTGDRAGLIWVGEAFYPTADEFMREAHLMGVSRRITAVPRGFVVGETWVYLGHRKAVPPAPAEFGQEAPEPSPGVVTLFKPTAIEYVLKDGEEDDPDLLASLEERGLTPVKVIRADQTSGDADVEDDE